MDYPPLFAWFEWALSWPARLIHPEMLEISAAPYRAEGPTLTLTLKGATLFLPVLAEWFFILKMNIEYQVLNTKDSSLSTKY